MRYEIAEANGMALCTFILSAAFDHHHLSSSFPVLLPLPLPPPLHIHIYILSTFPECLKIKRVLARSPSVVDDGGEAISFFITSGALPPLRDLPLLR